MNDKFKRKLTTILSADVVGYSRLMSDSEEETVRTLKSYRKVIESLIVKFSGRLVDNPGDNLLAEFASVVDALRCAWDIQQEIKSRNADLAENRRMTFRIGVNLGDVIEEDGRIYGEGVNVAARLESLAEAGGICISGNVYNYIENKVPFRFENQGKQAVKNIEKPVQVYRVVMQSETIHKETDKSIPVDEIPIENDPKEEESILDSIIDMSVPTDKPSIAVLPFLNISGDPEQEYFADGMTEEIITALSKVPDMLVIARNSTFVFKGKAVDVKQVGKELGVKYVLEGSIRKAGNRLRLTAQLIEAATGNHLWAERYDRNLEDIFELQDELTTRILDELSVKLYFEMGARWDVKRTNILEAHLKYLQGVGYASRINKNDNAMARKMLMEAIKLDPNWGVGYAGLAVVKIMDFRNGWGSSPDKCLKEAMDYAQKAVSIDSTLPGPYFVFSIMYLLKKQYREAILEAEKGVNMQPGFFTAYGALGLAFLYSGNPQKAQEVFKKGIRLSPKLSGLHVFLGAAYFCLGQYEESIRILKLAVKNMPDYIFAHVYLSASYGMIEMEAEAKKQAQEILGIDPDFSVDAFLGSISYKNQCDTDRILNALRKAGLK